jgi:hypothetical protein
MPTGLNAYRLNLAVYLFLERRRRLWKLYNSKDVDLGPSFLSGSKHMQQISFWRQVTVLSDTVQQFTSL